MTKEWNFIAIKYSTNSQTGNWSNCDTKKEANQYIGEENTYGNGVIFSTRKDFLSTMEKVAKEVGSGHSHMRGLYNAMLSAEKYYSNKD
jgi:hypothetical protein